MNCVWSNDTTDNKSIPWSIAVRKVEIPTVVTGLVYDGKEKTGIVDVDSVYCGVEGAKATNAGSHTATVNLNDSTNCCWTDNSTDSKKISWSIAKAKPEVVEAIQIIYYANTGEFVKTAGKMNVEGSFQYSGSGNTAKFTPDDTTNYETVEVEVEVSTEATVALPAMQID